VVEVGEGVHRVKKGDRVTSIIAPWVKGKMAPSDLANAIGAAVDGVAAKCILFLKIRFYSLILQICVSS
jgi:hypothetical protein